MPLLLRLCVCDSQLKCWNIVLTWNWVFHKPIFDRFHLPYLLWKKRWSNWGQKYLCMMKCCEQYQFTCGLLCHTIDWTENWHVAGTFSSPSVWTHFSGPPLYKESSNSSQVKSICSVTDRSACQGLGKVLWWWASWVQTLAGPLYWI